MITVKVCQELAQLICKQIFSLYYCIDMLCQRSNNRRSIPSRRSKKFTKAWKKLYYGCNNKRNLLYKLLQVFFKTIFPKNHFCIVWVVHQMKRRQLLNEDNLEEKFLGKREDKEWISRSTFVRETEKKTMRRTKIENSTQQRKVEMHRN